MGEGQLLSLTCISAMESYPRRTCVSCPTWCLDREQTGDLLTIAVMRAGDASMQPNERGTLLVGAIYIYIYIAIFVRRYDNTQQAAAD